MSKPSFTKPVVLMSIAGNMEQEPRELFEELPRGSELRSKNYAILKVAEDDAIDRQNINRKIKEKVKSYRGRTLVLAHSNPQALIAACVNEDSTFTSTVPLLLNDEMSDETKAEMAKIAADAVTNGIISDQMRAAIKAVKDYAKCQELFSALQDARLQQFRSPTEMIESVVTKGRGGAQNYDNTLTSFAEAASAIAQQFKLLEKQAPDALALQTLSQKLFPSTAAMSNPGYGEEERTEEERAYEEANFEGVNTVAGPAQLTLTRGTLSKEEKERNRLLRLGARQTALAGAGFGTIRGLRHFVGERDLDDTAAAVTVGTVSEKMLAQGILVAAGKEEDEVEVDLHDIMLKFNLLNNEKNEPDRQNPVKFLLDIVRSAAASQILEERAGLRGRNNDDIIRAYKCSPENPITVSWENIKNALPPELREQYETMEGLGNPIYGAAEYGAAGVAPAGTVRVRGGSQQGAVYTLASTGTGTGKDGR